MYLTKYSKLVLIFVFCSGALISLYSQGTIPEKKIAKIEKKTKQESAMYSKKGYKVYNSELSIDKLIREYYQYSYTVLDDGNRMYSNPIALGRKATLENAVENARQKSAKTLLGTMMLYFHSWINVDDRTDQEQKTLLIEALGKGEATVKKEYENLAPLKSYIFYKKNKKNYKVEIRNIFIQEKLKQICRKEIIQNLNDKGAFSSKKVEELLIFEK